MPTFGEYETVGDPIARSNKPGHVTTVWKAVKVGAEAGRYYAIKCYAPRRLTVRDGKPEERLQEDRANSFLAGIKELQKAHDSGGRFLASIHDGGRDHAGAAYYVTDFYEGGTLGGFIDGGGKANNALLRHVVVTVVAGCLMLKRSPERKYSHGNLKPGNVFLAVPGRELRKTPLLLTDPHPSPLQLSGLEASDHREAVGLLAEVMEAADVRAIGRLLLQLVERRLLHDEYEYNYPIEFSKDWADLGKDGKRWLDLCNKLLDPKFSPHSLETLNLESLEKEFQPSAVMARLPLILALVGAVCLVGGTAVYTITRNKAPRITQVVTQTLEAGQPATAVPLTVTDDRTAVERLKVEAKADQSAVVTAAAKLEGGRWHVELNPLADGTATVTVTVEDEKQASRASRFNVTVGKPNVAPEKVRAVPVAAQPTITPSGGLHQDSVQVALTCGTVGAAIYYTVDGTDPTASSPRYSQPVTLTKTTTVKARAFASGQKDSAIASATFTVTATPVAAQPTITPNGGSYQDSVPVALTCGTVGAAICYTVDGTDPTASSPRYSQPVTLTKTTTVKARAFASGQKDSAIASATFTVTATPVAAQPTITPNGGSYQDSVPVALTCGTVGAAICYTVDGTDPTASSPRYSQPVTLTKTTTVKARAFASGQKDSAIASATFTVTATPVAAQPTITPNGGSYQDSVPVALTCGTVGAAICYTVDGTDPTASSPRYSQPVTLTKTTTVKARAFASGQKDSAIASATFTVTATPVAAQPTITPNGGSYQDSVPVALTCGTVGAAIYYTVDGTDPTASSPRYSQPVTLTKTTTVKARAFASGQKDSAIASATFTVTATPVAAQPTITPNGGSYQDSVPVALTCGTVGAAIYYTVDGTDPTASSPRYSQPVTLTKTTTVKARAFASGQKDSAIASATFTVTATPVAAIAQPNVKAEAGKEITITLSGTGPPNANLSYKVGKPTQGELKPLSGATFAYRAPETASGSASFEFTASDGTSDSAPATVSITIRESVESRKRRALLDGRLTQLEAFYKQLKNVQEIPFDSADSIAVETLELERQYDAYKLIDTDRQKRLNKFKDDGRLEAAFKDARKKAGK